MGGPTEGEALVAIKSYCERLADAWLGKHGFVVKMHQQRFRLVAAQHHDGMLTRRLQRR